MMKEVKSTIEYNGKKYTLAFNLNTMAEIQKKYGSISEWGEMVNGKDNPESVDIVALRYGLMCMLNEGIDIDNEKNGTNEPYLTERQAGRIIMGFTSEKTAQTMNDLVIESVKTDTPKNT